MLGSRVRSSAKTEKLSMMRGAPLLLFGPRRRQLIPGPRLPERLAAVGLCCFWWLWYGRRAQSGAVAMMLLTVNRGRGRGRIPYSRSVSHTSAPLLRTPRVFSLPPASTTSMHALSEARERIPKGFRGGSCRFPAAARNNVSFVGASSPRMERRSALAASSCHDGTGGGPVTAANSRSSQKVAGASRVLGHGDFAGLTANFHWPSGDLVEIPQHLVPKTLVEWGQVPTCLEVLTSESPDESGDSGTDRTIRSARKMARHTITVLPSIGCAVDNLETITSGIERFETCSILPAQILTSNDEAWPVRVISYWPTNHLSRRRIVVEATFPIENPVVASATREGLDCQEEGHRIRMSVPLELTDRDGSPRVQPVSPISITCERMVSQDSSGGTLADGGGLDGQSVSRMLGPFLRHSYDAFAQKGNTPPFSSFVAEWRDRIQSLSSRDRHGSDDACMNFLSLPFNTTLSSWRSDTSVADFFICIGHIDDSPKTGDVTDPDTSIVHRVLQVRVPTISPHPEEAMTLNPSTFAFTAHVDRLPR